MFEESLEKVIREKFKPKLVDVLHSLFMDSMGVDELITFREWCADYWCGGENPADALECFEACKKSARFLRWAFGNEFETVSELMMEL